MPFAAPEIIPQTPENPADWQLDLFIPKDSTQPHCASCLQPVTQEHGAIPDYGVLAALPEFLSAKNAAGRLHMDHLGLLEDIRSGRLPACKHWGKYYIPRKAFIWFARYQADPTITNRRRLHQPYYNPLDLRVHLIEWLKVDPENRDQAHYWQKRLRAGHQAYLAEYYRLKALKAEAIADPGLPADAAAPLPESTTWYQ